MKRLFFSLITFVLLLPLAGRAYEQVTMDSGGLHVATDTTDRVGLYGVTPVAQRAGSAQTALTDSTSGSTANATLGSGALTDSSGGSASSTIAAATNTSALTDSTAGSAGATLATGVGVQTIAIPIQLASMTTAAADLITAYTPGYRFKVLALSFATTTLGTGTSASQVLNLAIGSTPVTGGVLTITLAGASTGTDVLGKLSAATTVTAANVGTASDTLSLKVAASGTVFTAGAGVLLVKLQNMDSADAIASIAAQLALQNSLNTVLINGEASLAAKANTTNSNIAKTAKLTNELRTSIVNLGAIKGSP